MRQWNHRKPTKKNVYQNGKWTFRYTLRQESRDTCEHGTSGSDQNRHETVSKREQVNHCNSRHIPGRKVGGTLVRFSAKRLSFSMQAAPASQNIVKTVLTVSEFGVFP